MSKPFGNYVYVTKKLDPIVLNDYAKVGSRYSSLKMKVPQSVWSAYEEYKESYLTLDEQVGKALRDGGYCPEPLMDAYEEAKELFFQAHEMFEQQILGKPIPLREGVTHKFNDDGTISIKPI